MDKRYMPVLSDLKVRNSENEAIIEGYFVVYNSETELWKGWFEEISPGAFADSLRNKDIVALDNHDSRIVLGSVSSNTLELRSDDKGLWGKVTIDLEDPNAKSAYRKVQTGKVKGCSFGFYPIREECIERDDGSIKWRVLEAELFEVSTTAFPAYTQTDISARQRDAESIKNEKLIKMKQQLKEMLK
ncbi:Caudovirus prohead protease [compost metagenome]